MLVGERTRAWCLRMRTFTETSTQVILQGRWRSLIRCQVVHFRLISDRDVYNVKPEISIKFRKKKTFYTKYIVIGKRLVYIPTRKKLHMKCAIT